MATNANRDQPLPDETEVHVGGGRFSRSQIQVPPGKGSKEFWKKVIQYQWRVSVRGLYTGMGCVILGVVLFYNGLVGHGAWTAEGFGVSVSDAAPGTVLFLIGLAIAEATKFRVNVRKTRPGLDGDKMVIVGRNFFWQHGIEVPGEEVDEEFWTMVLNYQYQYSTAGFYSGLVTMGLGLLMLLSGFIGTPPWSAEVLGLRFTNAAPGTVLFFIGLGFIYMTQFEVEIGGNRPNPGPLPEPNKPDGRSPLAPFGLDDNKKGGTGDGGTPRA